VSSQALVVGLRHEVNYKVVCVYTEARTVLTAAAADLFFSCWCSEIVWNGRIRREPRFVHYHAQSFLCLAYVNMAESV
jgi:hypothetical protein